MSVLHMQTSKTTGGIEKTIDKDNTDLALDILQRGIYAYPEKSMVRELASNAYDAILERITALKILNGEDKVEDHFVVEDTSEGIYKASGWDPDYFDPHFLSDDNNIYIYYEEGDTMDTFRIKDNGVGLGAERLTGYFSLAWSSKRMNKTSLGRWGLGNKSPLALGIDSYVVVNIYNGRKFKFEVSLSNINSITPKFSNGKANDYITVSVPQMQEDGSMVDRSFNFFFEETYEKNGLEIIVPVKKYMKDEIMRSIEEQLMYIPNVVVKTRDVFDVGYTIKDIAAKVLYRDENVVISESTVFNRPHILLGMGDGLINYGMVDFKALELDEKRGAVGLIMDVNEVEVTPSRESVVWSPKTRKALIAKYESIVETATKMITKSLEDAEDLIEWWFSAKMVKSSLANTGSKTNNVLAELGAIVDPNELKDLWYKDANIVRKYTSSVSIMLGKSISLRMHYYNKYNRKMERNAITSISDTPNAVQLSCLYYMEGNANRYIDRYLQEQNGNVAYVFRIAEDAPQKDKDMFELIKQSKIVKSYNDIEVPDDILVGYLEEEKDYDIEDNDEDLETKLTPWQRELLRRQKQVIVYHKQYGSDFTYSSMENSVANILKSYNNATTRAIYAASGDRDLLNDTCKLLMPSINPITSHFSVGSYRSRDVLYGSSAEVSNFITKLIGTSKSVQPLLFRKDLLYNFEGKEGFTALNDFIIKSYDDDGVLELNDELKIGLTISLLYKKLNLSRYDTVFYKIINAIEEHDQAISKIKETADKTLLYFTEALKTVMLGDGISYSSIGEFYRLISRYCVDKHIMGNDTNAEAILKEINENLPDALCDDIDEITDVKGINIDFYNQATEWLDYLGQYIGILYDTVSNYSFISEDIAILIKMIYNYEKPPRTKIQPVFDFRRRIYESDNGDETRSIQDRQAGPASDSNFSRDAEYGATG